MASEKRLIDANALLNALGYDPMKFWEITPESTFGIVLNAPTVDAVEVVRCKDCKHGMKTCMPPQHEKNYLCIHSWLGQYHEPYHFCAYGERRTDV